MRIKISSCGRSFHAELNSTKTTRAIWDALPITGELSWWGDEIYFDIDVKLPAENAQKYVEKGDVAYWIEGHGFCIFFGKTPISKDLIQPASPVNIFGKILDFEKAYEASKGMDEGAVITISRAATWR